MLGKRHTILDEMGINVHYTNNNALPTNSL